MNTKELEKKLESIETVKKTENSKCSMTLVILLLLVAGIMVAAGITLHKTIPNHNDESNLTLEEQINVFIKYCHTESVKANDAAIKIYRKHNGMLTSKEQERFYRLTQRVNYLNNDCEDAMKAIRILNKYSIKDLDTLKKTCDYQYARADNFNDPPKELLDDVVELMCAYSFLTTFPFTNYKNY